MKHFVDSFYFDVAGDLYVEDLGERRIVSVRMGWLWVEGTSMKLPLRTLNLRQAAPSICQPHELALGFTLSTSQGDTLATFWVSLRFNSSIFVFVVNVMEELSLGKLILG